MSKELVLYILLFTIRVVILTIVWHKYGWKAWGLAMLYALLTVLSEVPEVI